MKDNICFRKILSGEENSVCKLIVDCFDKFVGNGYSTQGMEEFYKYVDVNTVRERLNKNNFMIVALDNKEIIGVIEIRTSNYVSLFFVKEEYHNRGIGRRLFSEALEMCKKSNSKLESIGVNSSPYAVNVYRKLGFEPIDDEQMKNGIRFIPMRMNIKY